MLNACTGHTHIDLLKIDIEASEFETLSAILATFDPSPLPFAQLQLEVHAWGAPGRFASFLGWWEALERAGLRPFTFEANLVHVNLQRGRRPDVAEVRHLFVFPSWRGAVFIVS
jgi:hypothetical protein